jgi:hypothetical protein
VFGDWDIEFEQSHRCQRGLSIRTTNTEQFGGSVSCALNPLIGGAVELGDIKVPSLHDQWTQQSHGEFNTGRLTLKTTSQAGVSLLEETIFTALDIEDVARACRQGDELARFALFPDGPASGVNLRRIQLPDVEDGARVSVNVIGGLFTLIEDEVLGEGQLYELAEGIVMSGSLELDIPLPAFGWLSVGRVQYK